MPGLPTPPIFPGCWQLSCAAGPRPRFSMPMKRSAGPSPSRSRASPWTLRCGIWRSATTRPPRSSRQAQSAMPRACASAAKPMTSTFRNTAAAGSISAISTLPHRSLPMIGRRSPATLWANLPHRRCRAAGRRMFGSTTAARSMTCSVPNIHCCALTQRHASQVCWKRPHDATCRLRCSTSKLLMRRHFIVATSCSCGLTSTSRGAVMTSRLTRWI